MHPQLRRSAFANELGFVDVTGVIGAPLRRLAAVDHGVVDGQAGIDAGVDVHARAGVGVGKDEVGTE